MFHPIIQIASLISAFQYGVLYIVLSSFADLWTKQYGYSVELSGLHYIALAGGEALGTQLGGPLIDLFYRRLQSQHPDSAINPESRIPFIFPVTVIASLGLLIYGWTAQFRIHWAVVDLGIVIWAFGGQIEGMPMSAYVMDAYSEHTSSAMAASQFLRSLTAFLFPLFAPLMYERLGYGWGNTCIMFVGCFLGILGPLGLWKWGVRLRERGGGSY
jgi:MFS family permease